MDREMFLQLYKSVLRSNLEYYFNVWFIVLKKEAAAIEFELIGFLTSHATIFQLYMWGGMKKKFDLRSGSQRHRHFVGFFYVPV